MFNTVVAHLARLTKQLFKEPTFSKYYWCGKQKDKLGSERMYFLKFNINLIRKGFIVNLYTCICL